MIEQLLIALVWLAVVGLIFYVLFWAVGQLGVPEPIGKVIKVLLVLALVIVVVYFLVGLLPAPGHLLTR